MSDDPARGELFAVWEVLAGRGSEAPDPGLSRTFRISAADWNGGDEPGRRLFESCAKEASDYAVRLMHQDVGGWVRLEFRTFGPSGGP